MPPPKPPLTLIKEPTRFTLYYPLVLTGSLLATIVPKRLLVQLKKSTGLGSERFSKKSAQWTMRHAQHQSTDCQGTGQESSIRSVHVSHSSARKSLAVAEVYRRHFRLEAGVARRLNRRKKRNVFRSSSSHRTARPSSQRRWLKEKVRASQANSLRYGKAAIN